MIKSIALPTSPASTQTQEQTTPVVAVEQTEAINVRAKARTREVSSRFMSPLVPSRAIPISAPTPSPMPDRHQLKYSQRWHHMQDRGASLISRVDANKMETTCSLESVQNWQHEQEQDIAPIVQMDVNKIKTAQSINSNPAAVAFGSHNQCDTKVGTSAHKRYQQRVKPPLKENNGGANTDQEHPSEIISHTKNGTMIARSRTPCPRPDTPNIDRIVPSRYKANPQNSANINGKGATASEAAKLLRESIHAHDPFQSSTTISKSSEIISHTKNGTMIARSRTPCPRPDTPNIDRIVPSRYKANPQNSANINGKGATASEAAKLLRESIHAHDPFKSSTTISKSSDDMTILLQKKLSRLSKSKDDSSGSCTSIVRTQSGGSCPTSPLLMYSNRTGVFDVHSSVQEKDVLAGRNPTSCCSESINEINCSMIRNSPCFRSLDFPVSRVEHASSSSVFRHRASNSTASSASFRPSGENHFALPPHPSSIKLGPDMRKGRKHHEDVHSLKLHYNHYLQWRFANARADVVMCSQEIETKRQLNSLGSKLSEMRDSVMSKKIELEYLQRIKALDTIVKNQMPYLNQWSALEEDYSTHLSEMVNSLYNMSLRLPTSGEVKVDVTELGEALNMALQTMETMEINTRSFVGMAEEMESLISELATVVHGERVLIHECGDHLFKTHTLQVEECSTRGLLIGLHQSNSQKEV